MGVDVPQKSERYRQMMEAAEAYFRLLRAPGPTAADAEAAEQRLNELAAPFSDDPAFQALLKLERETQRGRQRRCDPLTRERRPTCTPNTKMRVPTFKRALATTAATASDKSRPISRSSTFNRKSLCPHLLERVEQLPAWLRALQFEQGG